MFAWKLNLASKPISYLFARFNIDLISSHRNTTEQSSTALYSFDVNVVKVSLTFGNFYIHIHPDPNTSVASRSPVAVS